MPRLQCPFDLPFDVLKDERIAKEVDESLRYRDGKVYRLDAYCIMANHVHVVFAPLVTQPSVTHSDSLRDNSAEAGDLCYNSLSSIMQSLKGYTAWRAYRLLRRDIHIESYRLIFTVYLPVQSNV